jgi:hypothetical protein
MCPAADENIPLTLVIQRLMDADLLLPEEGIALLTEAKAFDQAQDRVLEGRRSESYKAFLASLEALQQTGCRNASIAAQAQAIVRQILHKESDPD